ncbi:MAG: RNA polymerase sigma factor [Verrucomicrobiae bacterium]|nr:RNA polymerase sigma factor [Verrucomicrobiae bacterium]
MSASDDSELVQRAKAGDDDAFARLASLYRGRITATASRYARGRPELEDLVQDIFIRAWKGLGKFREDAPFEHWIMRIAIRTCYDFLRRHRRRRELEILSDDPIPDRESFATGPANEDEELRRREAWEIVQRLLEQLGEKDRVAVTLIDLEQRSVKEAAALTGWSESNVKVRAFRARKRMQELYRNLTPRD